MTDFWEGFAIGLGFTNALWLIVCCVVRGRRG